MKQHYIQCHDFDIMATISQGDKIQGVRKVDGEDRVTTYTVTYKPVYFKRSGCWTLRCHHKGLNKYIKIKEDENLCEYIYIHPTTLHLYKFPDSYVSHFLRQKQLSQLTAKPVTFTMKQNNK